MAKLSDSGNPHQHISKQYDNELLDIRSRVLALGGLVEEQIEAAVVALVQGDVELARRVIENDAKVNLMEVSIDEDCMQILALRQPSARDLRLVVAVIKTIIDLERIGDEAKSRATRQACTRVVEKCFGCICTHGCGYRFACGAVRQIGGWGV